MNRPIEIYFIKDYKQYVDKFGKKSKSEYVLNVNKLIKEKLEADFVIPNKKQAFLLNYEIRKLIDKVINIKNKKYTRLIYQNYNLDYHVALSTLNLLVSTYSDIKFEAFILETDGEFSNHKDEASIKIVEACEK